jgi:hypothetical protein
MKVQAMTAESWKTVFEIIGIVLLGLTFLGRRYEGNPANLKAKNARLDARRPLQRRPGKPCGAWRMRRSACEQIATWVHSSPE